MNAVWEDVGKQDAAAIQIPVCCSFRSLGVSVQSNMLEKPELLSRARA